MLFIAPDVHNKRRWSPGQRCPEKRSSTVAGTDGLSRVEDIAGMGTIVLLLLLGWLACTALLTMGVGIRERDGRADKEVNSSRETSGSPAGID